MTTLETPWRVRTFGSLEVRSASGPAKFRTKKTASLVAILAMRPGERFRRDSLAALCWPDARAEASRQSLRMALSDIRSVLGAEAVESDRDTIQINQNQVSSDVSYFESLLELAAQAKDRRQDCLRQALSLVSGPFLPEVDGDWVTPEWFRLQDMVAAATVQFMELCEHHGDPQEGIRAGKRALGILGCREDLHIGLMKLYVSQGMTSLAIAQFEELEKQLDELWGEPPSQAAIDILESAPRAARVKPALLRPANKHDLIGRDNMLLSISEALLSDRGPRHVTLVGPGGCGKTTLARGVLQELQSRSNMPTWFVDLTSESTREGAARRIQSALGLPHAEQSEAIPAIGRFLKANPGVVVLDNYEQLVESGRALITELSSIADDARFIVTSRISLDSPDEQLLMVGPLDLPKPGLSLDEIRMCPAVELFERQAALASPGFVVTADNVAAVVELCRRLDGLPLAIELAAARVIVRSPAQILNSIHRSLDAIDSRQDPSKRHSSLSRTIEWSFASLSQEARDVCLGSSLFIGRFSEEDAQALADCRDVSGPLEELVKASMINADSNGDQTEFWMFETLRSFMHERLIQRNLREQKMGRYLSLVAGRARAVCSDKSLKNLEQLRTLLAQSSNYLSAIEFGVESQIDPDSTAQLCIDLGRCASLYGFHVQLGKLAQRMIEWPEDTLSSLRRAQLIEAWVNLTANMGDLESQYAVINRALELAGDHIETVTALYMCRGSTLKAWGRYDEARDDYLWALEHCSPNDHDGLARAHYSVSQAACCVGDHDTSLARLLAALQEARLGDDPNLLIRVLFDCGAELAHHGRGEEALPLFEEAVEYCITLDSRKMEGLTRWQQGDAFLSMGRNEEALDVLRKSVRLVVDAGFIAGQKWIYLKLGEALARCGHLVLATKLLGKGTETRRAESRPLAVYEQTDLDRVVSGLRETLGNAAFDRHWTEGYRMDWPALMREIDLGIGS